MFNRDNDEPMKPLDGSTSTGESIIGGLKGLVRRRGFWLGVGIFAVAVFLASNDILEGTAFLVGAAVLYFLPAVIARNKPNSSSVFVINLFLGWTLIGWVVALAMAVRDPQPPVVVQQAPPSQPVSTGRTCPFCAEDIKPAAIVCKHCGRDLPNLSD
jgi:hypothetical protein